MKRIMLAVAVLFCVVGSAEAGLLDKFNTDSLIGIINASEPSIAWGYNFAAEERVQTATLSLITYSNRDLALGSLRGGYAAKDLSDPEAIIGAFELVTPNLVRRFIPEQAKDWKANLKVLTLIPSVSVFGGYEIKDDGFDDDKKWAYGFTIGPKVTF